MSWGYLLYKGEKKSNTMFGVTLTENEKMEISKLPKTQSWEPPYFLHKYQGFWYPPETIKGIILFQKNFVPQPTDIVLCSTPKCGTTWLKALSFAILTRIRNFSSSSSSNLGSLLFSKSPQDVVPFIEWFYALGKARDPQLPLIHTHVPFSFLPESILKSNSKIIYICRDPKDAFISLYFFESKIFNMLSLREVYEMFCNGVLYGGPFWDHVLGYWKASLEFPEKVLFLKYEDLRNDTYFYVKKIADFMGYSFAKDEEKSGVVKYIAELCSFENLSTLDVNKNTQIACDDTKAFSNASFFRKGEVGDWKHYLTPQMAERIDQITHEKFNPYGLKL